MIISETFCCQVASLDSRGQDRDNPLLWLLIHQQGLPQEEAGAGRQQAIPRQAGRQWQEQEQQQQQQQPAGGQATQQQG